MRLRPFKLDEWLEQHERSARFNLAASTGPSWTMQEIVDLMSDNDRRRLYETPLTYCPGEGSDALRAALAEMYGTSLESVMVVTGASEVFHAMFFLAAKPGANIVLPDPTFPPFVDIPEAYGIELRSYPLRHESGFAIDVDAIADLIDERTELVLVNSPHNPTGAVIDVDALARLGEVCAGRGVQLVADEVYHPIYHGGDQPSAGSVTQATVVGDFSKAFSLPGVRLGYVIEPDENRRHDYWNCRAHFTISNNFPGELLGEVAVRHRDTIFSRTRELVARNLARLDQFFAAHADSVEWVRPRGGMTGFPRMTNGASSRPFCEAAVARGVVLVPGDCFGQDAHFRLGFGACDEGFDDAVSILETVLTEASVTKS